jgi:hypothetical protein
MGGIIYRKTVWWRVASWLLRQAFERACLRVHSPRALFTRDLNFTDRLQR